jgi:hypothetical protein
MNPRRLLPLSAALLLSAAVTLPAAVPASANHATLFALEIFAPEGEAAAPLCNNPRRGAEPLPSADLPAGTVSVAVIQGTLPRGAASVTSPRRRGCQRFPVSIGSQRFVLYKSADTRVDNVARLDDAVRVVAAQDEQTGVLVAERVVGRAVARNEIERAFLATVNVVERGATQWRTTEVGVGGRPFTFDVTAAEIDPGLGTQVAVEFDTVAPVPD